jgi:predicted nuclease of predicted toxin-antitoxin system
VSARLALDEMFSPQIAAELVRRGYDAVAVAADPALADLPDEQVLEWATSQGRCLVTENVKDYEVLRRTAAAQGRSHAGLLYCAPRRFPRDRRFIGVLVAALDRMPAGDQLPGPDEVGWLIDLPVFGEGGTQPGVDLDDSAALLDLMEQDDPPAGDAAR